MSKEATKMYSKNVRAQLAKLLAEEAELLEMGLTRAAAQTRRELEQLGKIVDEQLSQWPQ